MAADSAHPPSSDQAPPPAPPPHLPVNRAWRLLPQKDLDRGDWVVATLAFAGGSAFWMAWAAGPFAAEDTGLYFIAAVGLAAAFLGTAQPSAVPLIGFSLVAGPFVLAIFTAPRGDGDGLWVFIFPYLVVLGVLASAVALGTSRLRRRLNHDSIGLADQLASRRAASGLILAAVTAGTVFFVVSQWPDPHGELRSLVDPATFPDTLLVVEMRETGDPLYSRGGAAVTWELAGDRDEVVVCEEFAGFLNDWSNNDGRLENCHSDTFTIQGGPSGTVSVRALISSDDGSLSTSATLTLSAVE